MCLHSYRHQLRHKLWLQAEFEQVIVDQTRICVFRLAKTKAPCTRQALHGRHRANHSQAHQRHVPVDAKASRALCNTLKIVSRSTLHLIAIIDYFQVWSEVEMILFY